MTEETSISDYIQAIENLAENRFPLIFENSKPENAAIVFSRIFKYANKEVRIYDNCLDGDIADQHESFAFELEEYLRKGNIVKIVLRQEAENYSVVFERLAELYHSQFDIRLANNEFRDNVRDVFQRDIFFAVNDKKALRMEAAEEIKEERKAICSFYNPELAKKLINAFDKSFDTCSNLDLPQPA